MLGTLLTEEKSFKYSYQTITFYGVYLITHCVYLQFHFHRNEFLISLYISREFYEWIGNIHSKAIKIVTDTYQLIYYVILIQE